METLKVDQEKWDQAQKEANDNLWAEELRNRNEEKESIKRANEQRQAFYDSLDDGE